MIHKHLLEIAEGFDTFLFDAYGVFNFNGLSKAATDVMRHLLKNGKQVSIISNTTQLSETTVKKYAEKGLVQGEHYIELLTSGQYTHEMIFEQALSVAGRKVYVAWTANSQKPGDKVPSMFKNSAYEIVDDINDADFAYCGAPKINGQDVHDLKELMPELLKLKASGLPLVCANPDLRALEASGFVIRHGSVSAEYEAMGGKVIYYGKPDKRVFDRALKTLGNPDKESVLMVGDTLRTDILGANNAGINGCLLLTMGITAEEMQARGLKLEEDVIMAYARERDTKIDFIVEKLPQGDLF